MIYFYTDIFNLHRHLP